MLLSFLPLCFVCGLATRLPHVALQFLMADKHKVISLVSWNVRGLGDPKKCVLVLDTLMSSSPTVVCLQETKLANPSNPKLRDFLPRKLLSFDTLPANGASGGVLTAWDSNSVTLVSSTRGSFCLTTIPQSTTTDLQITITNVYAPSNHTPSSIPR